MHVNHEAGAGLQELGTRGPSNFTRLQLSGLSKIRFGCV